MQQFSNCEQDFVTMTEYYTGHEGQPVSMQHEEKKIEMDEGHFNFFFRVVLT